jgi:hypothetical protein
LHETATSATPALSWFLLRQCSAERGLRLGRASARGTQLGQLALLLALLLWPLCLAAQSSPYTLYQLKALYLFNFAKYTEWPKEAFPDANSPFVLGILGQDPFRSDIDIIKGKTIKGRKLEIRKLRSVEEVKDCHLLFISSSETNNLPQILGALDHAHILTIAEADGFIEQNGMINLVPEQKSPGTQVVGFEINQAAAEKANLKMDTQLLKLAKRTKGS